MVITLPNDTGFVLHEQAETFTSTGAGWLSLKSFRNGHALYQPTEGTYRSSEDAFLILNHDERYTISIDSLQPVESLCVFFAPTLVSQVQSQLAQSDADLLTAPHWTSAGDLPLLQRTYQMNDVFYAQLERLRSMLVNGTDSAELTESTLTLLERILGLQPHLVRERNQLPSVRAATRGELYRRLYLVKEYLHAYYDRPIALDDMGRIAGLSTNHLLRTFKALFGRTPYQYLTDLRLNQACKLLRLENDSVTEICLKVGYESLGTFSHKFRKRYGVSPQKYRQQSR